MSNAAKADLAKRLLETHGVSYDINRQTQTPTTATPWKVESTATSNRSVFGILDDFKQSQRDGVVVKNTDRKYLVAAKGDDGDFVPAVGDQFVDDTDKLEIINVQIVRAGASDVLYSLHVRV